MNLAFFTTHRILCSKKVNKFLFISAQSKTSVRKSAQLSEIDVLVSLSDKNMVDILFRIDNSSIIICIIRHPYLFFNNIVINAEIFVLK